MKTKKLPLFLIFAAFPALAMIPPAQTVLNLQGHEPMKEDSILNQEQAKKLIPADMKPTEDQGQVTGRFIDKGMKYILESDALKKNATVQRAQKAGEVLNTNVSLGDPNASGIHHNIETQADVFQGVEKLHYSGFFSANVIYHNGGNLEMNVDRKLDGNKTLILKHTSSDDLSALQISWNW